MIDAKEVTFTSLIYEKVKLDNTIDTAIDDTMSVLIEQDSKNSIILNREKAIAIFYQSIQNNLGLQDDKVKRELLKVYFPIIVVIDIDGFYIQYHKIEQQGEEMILRACWTEKFPYVDIQDNVVYQFSIGNEKNNLCVVDNNVVYNGTIAELETQVILPEKMKDNFEQYRRNVIIHCLKEKMQYFIDEHNEIAKKFNIAYNFYLPNIENDDWIRTIDDISMMTFFQGYPYETSQTMIYNRYTISGARINKRFK